MTFNDQLSRPAQPMAPFRLENVLVATDFSPPSKTALLYGIGIARRHHARLLIVNVATTQSEGQLMDAWRVGQSAVMEHYIAGRLSGVQHELLVKSGDVWAVLAQLIPQYGIDLVVVGTRGRTGVWKLLLGSVAQRIFRQAPCPVLTVGPSLSGQDPEESFDRILVPTGFAPQSLHGVTYGRWLAKELRSSLALLHVATNCPDPQQQKRLREERMVRLRALIPAGENSTEYFVEFGSVTEKVLECGARWNSNLIVLGLHHLEDATRAETSWAKAYDVVCQAGCPVLTVRAPDQDASHK